MGKKQKETENEKIENKGIRGRQGEFKNVAKKEMER